jgi:hypothetical protein
VKIPLRADVHCTDIDDPIGCSLYVILNPIAEQLTHVVVRDRQRLDVERLVPLGLVEEAAPKRIWLSCTKSEFRGLKTFIRKEFIRAIGGYADYGPDDVLAFPYVLLETGSSLEDREYRSVSLCELAIRRGSRVEAANGPIGMVGEFVVHPADGNVTHLVLGKDHPWGERDVAIPVADIERVRENVVYLRLNKLRIRELPPVPVLRKWT